MKRFQITVPISGADYAKYQLNRIPGVTEITTDRESTPGSVVIQFAYGEDLATICQKTSSFRTQDFQEVE